MEVRRTIGKHEGIRAVHLIVPALNVITPFNSRNLSGPRWVSAATLHLLVVQRAVIMCWTFVVMETITKTITTY